MAANPDRKRLREVNEAIKSRREIIQRLKTEVQPLLEERAALKGKLRPTQPAA
jgi:hypothetical protein